MASGGVSECRGRAACLAPAATIIIPIVKFGTWILNYHYDYFKKDKQSFLNAELVPIR